MPFEEIQLESRMGSINKFLGKTGKTPTLERPKATFSFNDVFKNDHENLTFTEQNTNFKVLKDTHLMETTVRRIVPVLVLVTTHTKTNPISF